MSAGRGKSNPRRANSHRRNMAVARVRARHDPCSICGQPIDYDLPPGDPMCFEADDIVPVSKGGDPCDPDNLRASHRICNQRRGNRDVDGTVGPNPLRVANDLTLPQSRDW